MLAGEGTNGKGRGGWARAGKVGMTAGGQTLSTEGSEDLKLLGKGGGESPNPTQPDGSVGLRLYSQIWPLGHFYLKLRLSESCPVDLRLVPGYKPARAHLYLLGL